MSYALYEEDDLISDRSTYAGLPWPYHVFLPDVATPPWDWLAADVGQIGGPLVAKLEEHGYDQLPIAAPGEFIGYRLISSSLLKTLQADGSTLQHGTGYLANDIARVSFIRVQVDEVIGTLCNSRAVLLYEVNEHAAGSLPPGVIFGLLSIVDLERPPIRKALFELLLDLEAALARLVEQEYQGGERWIELLSPRAQIRILGGVEYALRRKRRIRPMEELFLPELLTILTRSDAIRSRLNFESRKQATSSVNRIVRLRNLVAHPGRTMASGVDGVRRLHRSTTHALDLLSKAKVALGDVEPPHAEDSDP